MKSELQVGTLPKVPLGCVRFERGASRPPTRVSRLRRTWIFKEM